MQQGVGLRSKGAEGATYISCVDGAVGQTAEHASEELGGAHQYHFVRPQPAAVNREVNKGTFSLQ